MLDICIKLHFNLTDICKLTDKEGIFRYDCHLQHKNLFEIWNSWLNLQTWQCWSRRTTKTINARESKRKKYLLKVRSYFQRFGQRNLFKLILKLFLAYLVSWFEPKYFLNVSIADMGRVYLENFGGARIFSCLQCGTFLTNRGELISTRFTGATGRAFLFNKVVNLKFRFVASSNVLEKSR